jgi:transposase-like protein
MDMVAFLERFPDQQACRAHLEALRWPEGTICPKCNVLGNSVKLPRLGYWQCRDCRAQFNVLNGTPMQGTHLPLRSWFAAIFLTATSGKGISAMVLSRQLDVGYKTAWFLAHRIHNLMARDWEALRGMVGVYERYPGGKHPTKRASKRDADGGARSQRPRSHRQAGSGDIVRRREMAGSV